MSSHWNGDGLPDKWCWDNQTANWKMIKENMGDFLYNVGVEKSFLTMTQNLDAIKD